MQRIDSKGNVNGTFQDKSTAAPGTILSAKWLNDVQEEIVNAIVESKIALAPNQQNQLSAAITSRIQSLSNPTQNALQTFPSVFDCPDAEVGFPGAKPRDTFNLSSFLVRFGNGMAQREFFLQPTSGTGPFGIEFPNIAFAQSVSIGKRVLRIQIAKSAANMVFTLGFVIAARDSADGRGYITPSLNVRADAVGNLTFTFGEAASLGLLINQDSAIYQVVLTSAYASGFVKEDN